MTHDFIKDISNFIFVSDPPEQADVIFIPGGSYPELPEKAAELFHQGYAPYILPSGQYSIQHGHFVGVRTKTEIYTGPFQTEFGFMKDVLLKKTASPKTQF